MAAPQAPPGRKMKELQRRRRCQEQKTFQPTTLRYILFCSALLCSVLFYSVLCCAVLCCAVLCCAVLCCAVL
eukprot:gene62-biopygen21039